MSIYIYSPSHNPIKAIIHFEVVTHQLRKTDLHQAYYIVSPSTLSSTLSSKPNLSPSPCKLNNLRLCRPAPEVPHIQQAYSKRSDSVTVEFTEVAGATSYILRAESLDGGFFSETVVSSSPGTVVQLQPYTSYRLSVMSVNSGGQSQPSHFVQARTGNVSYPKCMSQASSEDIDSFY